MVFVQNEGLPRLVERRKSIEGSMILPSQLEVLFSLTEMRKNVAGEYVFSLNKIHFHFLLKVD